MACIEQRNWTELSNWMNFSINFDCTLTLLALPCFLSQNVIKLTEFHCADCAARKRSPVAVTSFHWWMSTKNSLINTWSWNSSSRPRTKPPLSPTTAAAAVNLNNLGPVRLEAMRRTTMDWPWPGCPSPHRVTRPRWTTKCSKYFSNWTVTCKCSMHPIALAYRSAGAAMASPIVPIRPMKSAVVSWPGRGEGCHFTTTTDYALN